MQWTLHVDVLRYENCIEDQILILDYLIKVIKTDLQAECMASIFYTEDQDSRAIEFPFPSYYYDENLISYSTKSDEIIPVNLSLSSFIVVPWNRQSMISSIKKVFKYGFNTSANQNAFYYPYLYLCHVDNGTHSVSCGINFKEGLIRAYLCDIVPSFRHIYSDGKNWRSLHTNSIIEPLIDFRIGVIYEVAKIKYRLEQEMALEVTL